MAMLVGHGRTAGTLKGAIDGGTYWWVAPTLTQVRTSKIWKHLKRACPHVDVGGCATRISEVEKEIELVNGATLAVKSADSGVSLRGGGLDGVVIDEAPFLSENTWLDEIFPSLADTGGWAMLIGTPNGKNYAHKMFEDAATTPDWQAWQLPSSENPMVPQSYLDMALRRMGPRKFGQEHLAQFLDIEGAVFPGSYFERHLIADSWPAAFEATAIGVDASMGGGAESKHGDYSAIVFVGLSGGLVWIEADIKRRPPVEIVADVVAMHLKYHVGIIGVESNAFQGLLAPLFDLHCQKYRLPPLPLAMINNSERKSVRIQRLDAPLANKQLRIKHNEGGRLLIEQLQMFPSTQYHDDGPDALELASRSLWSSLEIDDSMEYEFASV